MTRKAQAAVLQLDPVRDQDEYNACFSLLAQLGRSTSADILAQEGGVGGRAALGAVWRTSACSNGRCGPASSRRRPMSSRGPAASPSWTWAASRPGTSRSSSPGGRRGAVGQRDGGAHSCSSSTRRTTCAAPNRATRSRSGPLDRIIQIAAEGRKYGLWLLLSSQRPSKMHRDPQPVRQPHAHADEQPRRHRRARTGSSASCRSSMLRPSTLDSVQGEALLAGGFVPVPMLVRMRDRLTYEGGSDVAVPVVDSPGS